MASLKKLNQMWDEPLLKSLIHEKLLLVIIPQPGW